MSRLQQSWANADFSEPFQGGNIPPGNSLSSQIQDTGRPVLSPHQGGGCNKNSAWFVEGRKYVRVGLGVGEGHMRVPKECLSAQMSIVLKQVNNGKCLSALLATINICWCSGNAVTQSRNRLLFALSPVQWTKNTWRRHSGATGVRCAQMSITPIRQSCPTDQDKEFYLAILCWDFFIYINYFSWFSFLFFKGIPVLGKQRKESRSYKRWGGHLSKVHLLGQR